MTGLAALFDVPIGRPSGWLASRGEDLYLVHGVIGLGLGVGALALLTMTSRDERRDWGSAVVGAAGVAVAGVGGVLCADHGLRIAAGMGK